MYGWLLSAKRLAMAQAYSPRSPYYPQDARIPNYRPNVTSLPVLSASLASLLVIVLATALWLAARRNPRLTRADRALVCWFMLCGVLHCFFEGYFVLNHSVLAGSQDLFAQLWKEYALSDSRYLTSDPFMLCVEAITAVAWGPLSFSAAVSIARGSSLRYPLQISVCVAHLYGVALYYSTCFLEERWRGRTYSRPEFLYYWVYYIGFNAPWVVVPLAILWSSIRRIQRVFSALDRMSATLDSAGARRPKPFDFLEQVDDRESESARSRKSRAKRHAQSRPPALDLVDHKAAEVRRRRK